MLLIAGKHDIITEIKKVKKDIISIFLSNANVPLFDTAPYNIIIKKDKKKISWFHVDFHTFKYLTSPFDDIITLTHHYCVPLSIRKKIIEHFVQKSGIEYYITLFVRMSRCWSRAYYYQRFKPSHFKETYSKQGVLFYFKEMICALSEIIRTGKNPTVNR